MHPYIGTMPSSLPSPRTRFGIRFSLLARHWRRALDAHLAATGMTDATWAPLVHLQETGGGITQKELGLLVGMDKSSLVRVIDILVGRGLVERRQDATDGRARLIHLTELGGRRVAEIREELFQAEDRMLAGLSDAEIETMLGYLERIEQRLVDTDPASPEETSR